MNQKEVEELLADVGCGNISVNEALEILMSYPIYYCCEKCKYIGIKKKTRTSLSDKPVQQSDKKK